MNLTAQIRSGLQNQGLPRPSLTWIQNAMPMRHPLPPLPALVATVKTRFLATDLMHPGLLETPAPALPPNLSSPQAKQITLAQDVPVQVLDIDNLSKSKWDQVEELEAIARGEQTRGREIIRLPTGNEEDDGLGDSQSVAGERPSALGRGGGGGGGGGPAAADTNASGASKSSTHRLVLQDCNGQKVFGLELKRIEKIGIGTLNIGEKLLLKRGTIVARGMVLLEPANCIILGGKVESWQKTWVEGRLARLREAVGGDNRN